LRGGPPSARGSTCPWPTAQRADTSHRAAHNRGQRRNSPTAQRAKPQRASQWRPLVPPLGIGALAPRFSEILGHVDPRFERASGFSKSQSHDSGIATPKIGPPTSQAISAPPRMGDLLGWPRVRLEDWFPTFAPQPCPPARSPDWALSPKPHTGNGGLR
jgi:hypothetical protein